MGRITNIPVLVVTQAHVLFVCKPSSEESDALSETTLLDFDVNCFFLLGVLLDLQLVQGLPLLLNQPHSLTLPLKHPTFYANFPPPNPQTFPNIAENPL